MKINIQKCVKWMTSILAILGLVLVTLPSPVSAVAIPAYDPSDFISNVTVDGDVKTVTFDFSELVPYVVVWESLSTNTTVTTRYSEEKIYLTPEQYSVRISGRMFPFGSQGQDNQSAPADGGLLDVSDLCAGAPVSFFMSYGIHAEMTSGYDETVENALTVRLNNGLYKYDKDGNYLGVEYLGARTEYLSHPESYYWDYTAEKTWYCDEDVAYILPFISFDFSGEQLDYWSFSVQESDFTMSTDINMVLEQSQTMDEIKNQVTQNGEKLDDVNDNLEEGNKLQQETNDKLDEIIDGRSEEIEDSENLKDEIANQGQIVDDALAEKDALLNKPDPEDVAVDLDDYIDPYYRGQVVNAFAVFTGLPFPTGMLGVVCGIIVVSYVLFGKKG